MELRHIPGVSIGVVKEGRVLLAKGYGVANVELAVPATPDTAYGIMSVTKQFTAAAVLLLADEGKLSLDEKIPKYVSDAPVAWKDISIKNLLSHTSGIPDYTGVDGFFQHIRQDSPPRELIEPITSRPLQFPPGTRWRYSNSNYYLLGMIVEKVSGQSLDEFLTTAIFRPLGMNSTRLNDLTDVIPNRAAGYQWIGDNVDRPPPVVTGYHGPKNVLQNAIYLSPTRTWAAGGIVSNVTDLVRWEQALLEGKLLRKETIAQMQRPFKLGEGKETEYGYGNELGQFKGHHIAGHQGSGVAFNAALLRLVDDRLSVIVLCNQTTAPSLPIAMHIAGIYVLDLAHVID
jgi:CubicO group peptidase (beta-lactamase class C family)